MHFYINMQGRQQTAPRVAYSPGNWRDDGRRAVGLKYHRPFGINTIYRTDGGITSRSAASGACRTLRAVPPLPVRPAATPRTPG